LAADRRWYFVGATLMKLAESSASESLVLSSSQLSDHFVSLNWPGDTIAPTAVRPT